MIQKGCSKRSARIWANDIPLKVYQRKKALMSRPGIVLSRLRLREAAVMQTPPNSGKLLEDECREPGRKEACCFHCIVRLRSLLDERSRVPSAHGFEQTAV